MGKVFINTFRNSRWRAFPEALNCCKMQGKRGIFVFFNGARDQPVEQILKLSDAFIEPEERLNLELVVRVVNINPDKHHEMLEKCNVLREYSLFVEETRRYSKDEHQLGRAVNECIKRAFLQNIFLGRAVR